MFIFLAFMLCLYSKTYKSFKYVKNNLYALKLCL